MTKEEYDELKKYLHLKVLSFEKILKEFNHKGTTDTVELKKGEIIPYNYAREFFSSNKKERAIKGFLRMIRTLKGPKMDEIIQNSVFLYTNTCFRVSTSPYEKMKKRRGPVIVNHNKTVKISCKNCDSITYDGDIPVDVLSLYGLSERIISLLRNNGIETVDIFDTSVKKIKGIGNGSLKKIQRSVIAYFGEEEIRNEKK